MIKIRNNVFETNSSSTHSVSIRGRDKELKFDKPTLSVNNENMVVSGFGEFGWEVESYIEQDTKLRYLLTMIMEFNKWDNPDFEIYQDEDFKKVEEVVKEYCNCDGIEIDSEIRLERYDGYCYWKFDGYIDHQSIEDYRCLGNFLNDYGLTIKEFIFSPDVVLHTDNDNH